MEALAQTPHDPRNRALSMEGSPMSPNKPHSDVNGHQHHVLPLGGPTAAAFASARSPPKAKNTSHVPCKFYPYGTCQAGNACQFSHDLGTITQSAPCKYFAKGSCKFGHNCALAHVLPDGRVVNRSQRVASVAQGRRISHLNTAIQNAPPGQFTSQNAEALADHQHSLQSHDTSSPLMGQPISPSVRVSHHNISNEVHSPYGSPFGGGFPASPSRGGRNALDAPLPGSFDSQRISLAARHGPFASSLPPWSGHGFESPPSSLPNNKKLSAITTMRDARGALSGENVPANLDGVLQGLGSSPRDHEPINFGKRPLHSERFAKTRPTLSASLDTRPSRLGLEPSESDDGSEDGVGEDLLPSSLHDLLPQDRFRRSSRSSALDDGTNPFLFASSPRRGFTSNNVTPIDRPGNLSPVASSPSRYSSMWAARPAGSVKTESEPNVSAFGHVGSPLRTNALRTLSPLVPMAPSAALAKGTPARRSQGSLSMLTNELQRSKLSDNKPKQSPLSLLAPQNRSGDDESAEAGGANDDKHAAIKEKTDEETMFSMEEDGEGEAAGR